jgi:magnesium transporter
MFVIMGALCDFASLSFAPQSVVMPVGSLTLVANVFFAHYWLGEDLGTTDIIGTSFIVGGASIIAVAYGALGETISGDTIYYDASDLVELYHRWVVFLYGITVLSVLAGFFYVMKKAERLVQEGKTKSNEYTGLISKLHPISYAAVAGIFGSFSVTFGKAIGELLAATSSDEKGNQFEEPFMYVISCFYTTHIEHTHTHTQT